MKKLRLILILLTGGYLTCLTFKSMYSVSIVETIIWDGLIIIGMLLLTWTFIKDMELYRTGRRIKNYWLSFTCLLFIAIIVPFKIKIQNDHSKPTLVRVFYNGDFNGSGIDFKTNGTYIFDNSAIGMSDFYYGTYKIDGDKITLDRDTIDNLTDLKNLEIREKEISYDTVRKKELYLFQVDKNGNVPANGTEYRVIVDKRRK